jgi:hypothetical protein
MWSLYSFSFQARGGIQAIEGEARENNNGFWRQVVTVQECLSLKRGPKGGGGCYSIKKEFVGA